MDHPLLSADSVIQVFQDDDSYRRFGRASCFYVQGLSSSDTEHEKKKLFRKPASVLKSALPYPKPLSLQRRRCKNLSSVGSSTSSPKHSPCTLWAHVPYHKHAAHSAAYWLFWQSRALHFRHTTAYFGFCTTFIVLFSRSNQSVNNTYIHHRA